MPVVEVSELKSAFHDFVCVKLSEGLSGRDDVYRELDRCVKPGSLLLVRGDPGIGKSTLLANFIAQTPLHPVNKLPSQYTTAPLRRHQEITAVVQTFCTPDVPVNSLDSKQLKFNTGTSHGGTSNGGTSSGGSTGSGVGAMGSTAATIIGLICEFDDFNSIARDMARYVCAYHICMIDNARSRQPGLFVRSIAHQLAQSIPRFRQILRNNSAILEASTDPETALVDGVLKPLALCSAGMKNRIWICIDSFDESLFDAFKTGGLNTSTGTGTSTGTTTTTTTTTTANSQTDIKQSIPESSTSGGSDGLAGSFGASASAESAPAISPHTIRSIPELLSRSNVVRAIKNIPNQLLSFIATTRDDTAVFKVLFEHPLVTNSPLDPDSKESVEAVSDYLMARFNTPEFQLKYPESELAVYPGFYDKLKQYCAGNFLVASELCDWLRNKSIAIRELYQWMDPSSKFVGKLHVNHMYEKFCVARFGASPERWAAICPVIEVLLATPEPIALDRLWLAVCMTNPRLNSNEFLRVEMNELSPFLRYGTVRAAAGQPFDYDTNDQVSIYHRSFSDWFRWTRNDAYRADIDRGHLRLALSALYHFVLENASDSETDQKVRPILYGQISGHLQTPDLKGLDFLRRPQTDANQFGPYEWFGQFVHHIAVLDKSIAARLFGISSAVVRPTEVATLDGSIARPYSLSRLLHNLVELDRSDCIKETTRLVLVGQSSDQNIQRSLKRVLEFASRLNKVNALRSLLENGASFDQSIIHVAGSMDIIRLVHTRAPHLIDPTTIRIYMIRSIAAAEFVFEKCGSFDSKFLSQRSRVDETDPDRHLTRIQRVSDLSVGVAQVFLRNDAKPNAVSYENKSAVHYAVLKSSSELLRLYLKHGGTLHAPASGNEVGIPLSVCVSDDPGFHRILLDHTDPALITFSQFF